MFARIFAAAFLFLNFALAASAEPYTQRQLETWVDGVLAEMKKAGATNTDRGAVTYDTASGAFSVTDIKITLPEFSEHAETKTDTTSKKIDIKREPVVLTIANISASGLKADGADWMAEKLQIKSLRLQTPAKPGALIVDSFSFDNIKAPQIAATLLGKEPGKQVAAFLQNASFDNGVMPSIVLVENEKDSKSGRFTLGEMRMTGYVKGKAATYTIADSTGSIDVDAKDVSANKKDGAKEHVDIKIGASKTTEFDLGLYADMFQTTPVNAGKKDLPLYKEASFTGASVKIGKDFSMTLNPITAENVRLNMPKKGLAAIFETLFSTMQHPDEHDKNGEELFENYREWTGIVSYDSLDSKGVSLKTDDTQFDMKSISGKDIGTTIGQLTVGNFSITSPELKMAFDSINLEKINTTTFYQALLEEMAKNKENPDFKA
ncbi:MAG: hypothetical protein V4691_07340, partial [Pseudomonadota bacterium]